MSRPTEHEVLTKSTISGKQDEFLESLRIALLLVENHGSAAPIQAAFRLYCLADLGEFDEFAITLHAMRLVETVRPDVVER